MNRYKEAGKSRRNLSGECRTDSGRNFCFGRHVLPGLSSGSQTSVSSIMLIIKQHTLQEAGQKNAAWPRACNPREGLLLNEACGKLFETALSLGRRRDPLSRVSCVMLNISRAKFLINLHRSWKKRGSTSASFGSAMEKTTWNSMRMSSSSSL